MDELVVRLRRTAPRIHCVRPSLYSGTKLHRVVCRACRTGRSPRRGPRREDGLKRGARGCTDARSRERGSLVKARGSYRAAARRGTKNRAEIQKVERERRDGHAEVGGAERAARVEIALCHRNDPLATELGLQRSENGVRSRDGHGCLTHS
jgi:hypothetical protein